VVDSSYKDAGYIEVPHGADYALKVWAPTFYQLIIEAAMGMYMLMGLTIQAGSHCRRTFLLKQQSPEDTIVSFLSELIFLADNENLYFGSFQVVLEDSENRLIMDGGNIIHRQKGIKAVTYHNLAIQNTTTGLQTTIVFDV